MDSFVTHSINQNSSPPVLCSCCSLCLSEFSTCSLVKKWSDIDYIDVCFGFWCVDRIAACRKRPHYPNLWRRKLEDQSSRSTVKSFIGDKRTFCLFFFHVETFPHFAKCCKAVKHFVSRVFFPLLSLNRPRLYLISEELWMFKLKCWNTFPFMSGEF